MADARGNEVQVGTVARQPTIGLVLGGGGARGLAHILMLEAFDELGIRPKVIAGTSIGAIFGAAYASGLAAAEIRAYTEEALTRRFDLVRGLFASRARRARGFRNFFSARTAFLQPASLLDIVLPPSVARDFSETVVPLRIVASDYYGLEPVVLSSGDLRTAVAASMALPALFEPVVIGGRTLVDGGLTNPLPFDVIAGEAEVLVAVDVSGVTVPSPDRPHPTAVEALFAASFLFERSIVREKLKRQQPDIYIDAGTGKFQVLDFLRVRDILASAEPAKAQLKAKLERVLASEVVREAAPAETAPSAPPRPRSRRGLLKRLRQT